MNQVDVLLTHGFVITMDAQYTLYADGAVAIKGSDIVAVGATADIVAQYSAPEVVECHGQVIMPGLVNAHTHVPMTLVRGLNDDLRLDVWLGYLMPLEREFVTPEFVKLGTELACAEMIRSGVTTFADMYYFEADIAAVTAKIGMRAMLGQTVLVFPAPDADTYEDALIRCRRFIETWNGHELIQPAVAPHAWYTGTPEMLRACADLARAYDVPLHTHISETAIEVTNCKEQHDMPVVPWNAQHGILQTKLLAAHCVHLDRGEMYDLRKAGAGVAHCPSSNLKLASGFAKVGQMVEMGLKVGVGTDGPASNNDLDMFEEVRLAALLSKAVSNDPTVLPARQALTLATIGGAQATHFDAITGSLEVGKRADIIMVDMDGLHNTPAFNNNPDAIYSRLIYAAKSSDVAHVMCHGRFLMRDRALLTVDEERVKREAALVAAQIDQFVQERESSTYNKIVLLAGLLRQESFEVQIKVSLTDDAHILDVLAHPEKHGIEITKYAHYRQFDTYFLFADSDPDVARLRYRSDQYVGADGRSTQERSRLTLIGELHHQEFPNAVVLSRSRYLAPATQSLRFYREYFAADNEQQVNKDRRRWRILYQETDFAINLDKLEQPEQPGYFLELKSRTWSRKDAERKSLLIEELMHILGTDRTAVVSQEYVEMATTE